MMMTMMMMIRMRMMIMRMPMNGGFFSLTSPTYFCTSSEPITLIKQASVLFATALAHSVFPVPGGPNRRTPFGGSIPKFTNRSG